MTERLNRSDVVFNNRNNSDTFMKINDTVLGPGDTGGCKTIFLTLRSSVLKETHTHTGYYSV